MSRPAYDPPSARSLLTSAPVLFVLTFLVAWAISACAPVADVLVDLVERNDGAALTYVLAGEPGGPGLAFAPGAELARGVIVRAEGESLSLLAVPENAECTVTTTALDCRLGDVEAVTIVRLTGQGVVANATWRRAGASTVYLTFAHVVETEGGG